MKFPRTAWFMLILLLVGLVVAIPARADEWNKKTIVTFSQPMEVPGNMTLAGEYVFKLHDSAPVRHIIQIWNEDETHLFTTILAIPNYRLTPTGEKVINFHERPGTQPQALRAWFYPNDNFGQGFAYPKKRALQLAEASNATSRRRQPSRQLKTWHQFRSSRLLPPRLSFTEIDTSLRNLYTRAPDVLLLPWAE